MNLFKNTTLTWWQVGMLKYAVLSIGIAIGAYWHDALSPYLLYFLGLGLVLSVYLTFVWFNQHES